MTIRSIVSKLLAVGFGSGFFYIVSRYPHQTTWLLAVLALYGAMMCWRPQLWLFALPALIPVFDLAPWTGWFFIEEIDLLLLITAAFGYWRLADVAPQARLPGMAAALASVLTLAYLIGAYRGLQPLPPPDANALDSYLSPYNSLRIGKAWFWTLALLPLLTRAAGPGLAHLSGRLVPGILTGLGLVCGAIIVERMTFPGLLNFSSDYRTSAPFSAMHTGGAALDGYLALSFPFVAVWLFTRQTRLKTATAVCLLALGAHACLTTFSRGLFVAYGCAALIIALFLLAPVCHARRGNWRRAAAGMLLIMVIVYALSQMFVSSGYRGFAAGLILLGAAFMLATQPIPWDLAPASVLSGGTIVLVLAALLPSGERLGVGLLKPPYLLFTLSSLVFAGISSSGLVRAIPLRRAGASAALMALTGMGGTTLWIAYHWSGPAALRPAAAIVGIAIFLIGINKVGRRPLWRDGRTSMTLAAAGAVIVMTALPIAFSYYASERFAGSGDDLRYRLRHWREVLGIMDDDAVTQSFGMGLGKFPASYFWRNRFGETPASLLYLDEGENRFLRLLAPTYPAGYGELLRLLQRVALQPDTRYVLGIDIRTASGRPPVAFGVALCERQLLYPQNCVSMPIQLHAPDSLWHRYQLPFASGKLGSGTWPLRAPTQIALAVEGAAGSADIDNVSLRDQQGGELIHNGTFTDTNDYWFFSSDRHHLPWHVKNLFLNQYFELGWLGVAALFTLLSYAFGSLFMLARQGQVLAAALFAALAAFLVVGMFDSLLDVPRLGLLFYLILLSALLRPVAQRRRPLPHDESPPP